MGYQGAVPSLGTRLLPVDPSTKLPAWARTIGVTRVARVTGLDRCGVEVACAIRPTGQVLQVSNGKGRTFADAKVAALSEALELWSCEQVVPEHLRLRKQGNAIVPFAKAERLDRRGEVFIPAASVWCPAGPISVGLRNVPWTANGIGAHPDAEQARWHGLLELFEREALCQLFPDGWTPGLLSKRGVRFEHDIAEPLRERGLRVHCVDATPLGWPIPSTLR